MKTKQEFQQHLIEKTMKDPDFRKRLLENPKAVIEDEIGVKIPGSVNIKIVEEDLKSVYLILPCIQAETDETELTESELDMVAGGEPFTGFSFCHTCGCDSFTQECQ